MIKLTRLAFLVLVGSIASCGGGGGDTDGGGNPSVDAGPDAGPTSLGHDALGAYNGAEMIAKWIEADEQLYRLTGDYLAMGGRETDPAAPYSFWTFSFISPGTGVTVDVVYSQGVYGEPYISSSNPEGKRLIPPGWFGSIEAISYLTIAGYTDPPAGDPNYRVGATLEMAPDVMIVDPIWRVSKVYSPPGMTPQGESWLVLYSTPDGGVVVCPPEPQPCVLL